MTEAISENKSRDIFNEMKKLNARVSTAPCMDGHVNNSHIAGHLARKYDELYNSVPSNEVDMGRIKDYILEHCEQCEHDHVVKQHDVGKVIEHLEANKSNSDVGFMLNYLIMCSEKLPDKLRISTYSHFNTWIPTKDRINYT